MYDRYSQIKFVLSLVIIYMEGQGYSHGPLRTVYYHSFLSTLVANSMEMVSVQI